MSNADDVLLVAEAAVLLRCSTWTLRRWIAKKNGPPYLRTPGGHLRFSRTAIDRWLAESLRREAEERSA